MLDSAQIEKLVKRLLDQIQSAALSLMRLLKAPGGGGLDLESRLDQISFPLLELVELQARHPDEVRMIVPIFAVELRDAYQVVSDARVAIDHRKRTDLDEMLQEMHELLRSLDALAPADGEPAKRDRHAGL
jgi:hypothetical protein